MKARLHSLFLCLLALPGQAAIIDNTISSNYLTDTTSGLDWLRVTDTSGTYNEVLAQMGVGGQYEGWSYATGEQLNTLLLNMGVGAQTCSDGFDFCGQSENENDVDQVRYLVSLMGRTDGERGIIGLLADEFSPSDIGLPDSEYWQDRQWTATVFDFVGNYYPEEPVYVKIHSGFQKRGYDPESDLVLSTGSFLVRPSEVPLPAAFWLFASGLAGLGYIKRKA